MRIKHSKYKNTGLIFELLVKQIAADTLNKQDSPAVSIVKKFFTGNSTLVREFKLYQSIIKNKQVSQNKAEAIVSTLIEVSRRLDNKTLKNQKYSLISEIKQNYKLEDFFSIAVKDYKALAAAYCLMEAHKANDIVDPNFLVDNKVTILEHLTNASQNKEQTKDKLIEEYSKYDKDLKILTFRILLEKFNDKYTNLLPEQKEILREFITSVESSNKLRDLVNEEIEKVRGKLTNLIDKIQDEVVAIKLQEVLKIVTPVPNTQKVKDDNLVNLMQYYELIHEISNA